LLLCDLTTLHRISKTDIQLLMFPEFLQEYLPIILFLIIALGLSCAFIAVNFILSPKNPDPEKLSAYECGFEPFEDSRMEFDVRFYLVAILFIIFDLEIAFLFPWAISLGNIGLLGFSSMMIFLFILTIGFIYEWKKGALDWE
jgi:NADH-quinone oxidoreductase subunit A